MMSESRGSLIVFSFQRQSILIRDFGRDYWKEIRLRQGVCLDREMLPRDNKAGSCCV